MNKYWSPSLAQILHPYTAGEQPQDDSFIKLNTNESPWPPSPLVIKRLKAAAKDGLQRYPDPDSQALREKLATYYGFSADNIFIGNGSDEVLAHTFKAFFQQELPIYFPDVSYNFYPVFCEHFAIEYRQVPVTAELQISLQDYPADNGGIIFANPNAPTGHHLGNSEIEQLLKNNTGSLVVIDEAYTDFANESAIDLCKCYDNLLIIRTLSKSRCLAGIRAGFAVGDSNLINALQRVKDSFNAYPLDSLAMTAAIAAYEDEKYFRKCCNKIIQLREWTGTQLQQLGFTVSPSQTNFLLVQPPKLDAHTYYQALKQRNILIRHFDNERISDYVRISIGSKAQMQALLKASKAILEEG
ncbi:MAG: histidinol-phosphate transaminase [Gammaproteobacteria bacterium]